MPISEGIGVSIVCMLVVFVVLFGLQMVLNLFGAVFGNKEQPKEMTKTLAHQTPQPSVQTAQAVLPEDDEESKTVALLTALILINQDQDNKHYQITSIERIR